MTRDVLIILINTFDLYLISVSLYIQTLDPTGHNNEFTSTWSKHAAALQGTQLQLPVLYYVLSKLPLVFVAATPHRRDLDSV